MNKWNWERIAAVLFCLLVALVTLFFVGRFLLSVLLPFVLGLLLSVAAGIPATKLSRRTRLSPRLCSVLFLLLFLTVGILCIVLLSRRLFFELERLSAQLPPLPDPPSDADSVQNELSLRILHWLGLTADVGDPSAPPMRTLLQRLLAHALDVLFASLTEQLPMLLSRIASALPSILLFLLLTFLSGFYFCVEGERMRSAFLLRIPNEWKERLRSSKQRLMRVSLRYLRAYLLLFSLSAGLLFVGFFILRVDYAFLLALLIALVDLLPVLGVGTILLPWAVIMLLKHNFFLGFGLLILYLVALVTRQIAEARLVGGSLGLSPLLTLLASYAGLRLLGILGLLLGPFLAVLIKTLGMQFFPNTVGKAASPKTK